MHGVRPVLGQAVFFCTELVRYRMLRGRCSAGSTGFSPGRTDTAHSSATPYRVMVRSTFCAVRDTKTRPLSYNWLQVFSACICARRHVWQGLPPIRANCVECRRFSARYGEKPTSARHSHEVE